MRLLLDESAPQNSHQIATTRTGAAFRVNGIPPLRPRIMAVSLREPVGITFRACSPLDTTI